MAKRPTPPRSDRLPGVTLEHHDHEPEHRGIPVMALLAESLETFEEFLQDPNGAAITYPLREELLTWMEKEPNIFKSLFASGFMAGIHAMIDVLDQTHDLMEQQERLKHTPKKNIPRA